ncbi:hypothetical protein GOP47_0013037 [Adiantum capillus-veneris]|uniref:Uncharacterized protein n=1 Tax=Adiantum capillus-veneris TaxID=13818 RepID=A0A9D4USC9_ADICA|nr:hypothetical protein GOP47_0013037 [Adiantum capillus-veneris]
MASLTRGISFRRQGSSGSTWAYNEEGILVRQNNEGSQVTGGSLSRIHNWQGSTYQAQPAAKMGPSPSLSILERSKSVGCAPARFPANSPPPVKVSKSRFMKWIKKAFHKLKS